MVQMLVIFVLRFVSGRSRLPSNLNDMAQRFIVYYANDKTDVLPTAQTCFFQIRLPGYSSEQIMEQKMKYAIRNCQTIDMDNHMLYRNPIRNAINVVSMGGGFFAPEDTSNILGGVNNLNPGPSSILPEVEGASGGGSVAIQQTMNLSSDESLPDNSHLALQGPSQEQTSLTRLNGFDYQSLASN